MDDTPSGAGPTGRAPADRDDGRARDAGLVAAALGGDRTAFGRLYDAWFDRVWNVARRIVHDPEVAAEVAQDAFLSAWRNLGTLEDPDAFGGWLLRIARNASFNRQRKESRSRAVDDRGIAVIEATGASPVSAPSGFGVEDRARAIEDPERVAGDAELVALVRESAAAMGERDAEVLDLQLRYGLSPAEIGEVMGMNRNAANQLCHRVRQRFATAVRARVLWRGERPACDALDRMLTSAGITQFDVEAVKMADKHAAACPQCSARRETRLQPSALFAAVPLVAAPVLFKQQTAHALEVAGVPMEGSASGGGDASRTDGDDDPGQRPRGDGRPTRSRRGRLFAMAGVATVVLVAAIAVLASRTHDGTIDQLDVAAGSAVTTTAGPSTIAVEPPPTSVVDAIVPETLAPDSTGQSSEPPPEPTPTDPEPEPIAVEASLTPDRMPTSYTSGAFPTLSWYVAGAASVSVEGPVAGEAQVLSTAPSGELTVCPGTGSSSFCVSPVGPYDYIVRAFDGSGAEVASRTVTLLIS